MKIFITTIITVFLIILLGSCITVGVGYVAGLFLAWLFPALHWYFVGLTGVGLPAIVASVLYVSWLCGSSLKGNVS